jgi:hypothetical protein
MFQPYNLNNLPTMAKLGGRPSIFKVSLCLAVAVVGLFKNSKNAKHREQHPRNFN